MQRTSGNPEPTIDDMLAEPIVQALMARDGVSEDEIRTLLKNAAAGRQRWRRKGTHSHARPTADLLGAD